MLQHLVSLVSPFFLDLLFHCNGKKESHHVTSEAKERYVSFTFS